MIMAKLKGKFQVLMQSLISISQKMGNTGLQHMVRDLQNLTLLQESLSTMVLMMDCLILIYTAFMKMNQDICGCLQILEL